MMTDAPQEALLARSFRDSAEDRSAGAVEWVLHWLQRFVCSLHGHDAVLQYERNRIFLRCTSCGHETPGWEVSNGDGIGQHRKEVLGQMPASDLRVARKIA